MCTEYFELQGITFVWDLKKERSNQGKHGISFCHAAQAFFDPFLKVLDASPDDDAKQAILGTDKDGNLMFVVHLESEADHLRIISARKATRKERRLYEN